jgi:hypothetical protein
MSSSTTSFLVFGHVIGGDSEQTRWAIDQVIADPEYPQYPDLDKSALPWLTDEWFGFTGLANQHLAPTLDPALADRPEVDWYGHLEFSQFYVLRTVEHRVGMGDALRLKLHQLADPNLLQTWESSIDAAMSTLGLSFADRRRPGWHLVSRYV